MAQNLPLEIIDHITNECLPDIEALRSSSLISKLWTITAQQRLFSRVSIFPELVRAVPSTVDFRAEEYSGYPFLQYILDGSIEKFKKHLEETPHLADFVKELHLGTSKRPSFSRIGLYYKSEEVTDSAFTGAGEIVARFDELESMSLFFAEDYDWAKLTFMHESLSHAVGSSKLRYLKIGHVVFATQSQFNELLGNCVALEVLVIDYVKISTVVDSETGQEAPEKTRQRLIELIVHTEPQSLSQIVQAFISPSSPVDVSSLIRLSLWCEYPKKRKYNLIGPICSLLQKTQCLQHLQLFACLTGPLYQYISPASLQTLYICDQHDQKSSSLSWLAKSLEVGSNSEFGLALTELSIDLYKPRGYSSGNLSTSSNDWAHLGATLELHARQLRRVMIRSKGTDFRRSYMVHRQENLIRIRSEDFRNAMGMRWREDVVIRFIPYQTEYEVVYSGSHCEDFYECDKEPTLTDWLRNWEIKDDPEGESSEEFQQGASAHPSQSDQ
ncbi:hypothetical protein EV421DRAFT_1786311 [Armillaria borealis]|uniref:Uncharacterized protein n=1 Tax=Armillaria borealis TaxID=47425 RepID=A0AA39MW29_9AGAR|nr:hypothetical protein EV421DRAFT_1786311 [Armillaria borealis]